MAGENDASVPLRDIRYLAFEGGGGRGMAYVAALQALYDALYPDEEPGDDFSWDLKGVSGSSVGAMTALMVALGYSPRAMSDLIVRDGLFAALFAEQIKVGRFCAAASALPGAAEAPLAGHFGAPAADKRPDPSDRAANLKAHCCPSSAPPLKTPPAEEEKLGEARSPGGLGKLLLDQLGVDKVGELLRSAIGPFLGANVRAVFATLGDLDTKEGETLGDAYSVHLLQALAMFLPQFLAQRLDEGKSPLGLFSQYAVLLEDEVRTAAKGASGEVKTAALLTQPAVLVVLLLVVLFGRNLEGDHADVLKFQEGRRPERRRDRKVVGRNNLVYYGSTLLSILLHQTRLGTPPDADAYRQFAKDTIGSPVFMFSLAKALGVTGESAAERKKAWRTLGRYCILLLPRHFGRGFGRMLSALKDDGGVWHGDRMRQVLAFVVLNKVAVVGEADPKGPGDVCFAMRDVPLVTTLSRYASFVTADLFTLVQRRTRAEARLDSLVARAERRAKAGKGVQRANREVAEPREKLDALEKKIADLKLPPELETAVAGGKGRLSPAEQMRAIVNWFDFSTLRALTGKDLVVTGTNVTSGRTVYFREGLTPDFPVVEAVRISGSFPILFKPTAVAYRPSARFAAAGRRRGGLEARERFYRLNYCGYFIDGGFLNNHPIDAFSGAGGAQEESDPQEMLLAPFRGDVLGFELTNSVPEPCPFGGTFRQTRGTRGLGSVLAGMLGTFYASGSTLRFLDPGIEERIVKVPFGNLDLFDLRPDYYAVLDTYGPIYDSVTRRITGSVDEGAGAVALDRMFGVFALRGAARSAGGRDDARRNQRQWQAAHKARKRLVQAEP